MMISRHSSGFSLIEVLVVVVVLGLLATMSMPRLQSARERTYLSAIANDFRNLGAAQERYFQVNRAYADALSGLDFSVTSGVRVEVTEASATGWAAVGRHAGLDEGKGCGIYLGDATVPTLPDGLTHPSGPGLTTCSR